MIIAYGHHVTRVEIPKVEEVTLVQAYLSLLAECLNLYALILQCLSCKKWNNISVMHSSSFDLGI